ATTERIHEPTKKVEKPQKVSSRVAPVTQQFTEVNVPGTSEDQEADELKIEFLPDSGKVGLPPQSRTPHGIDQKIVKLLDKRGFEVVKKLGEAGMWVVFLAKDNNLGGTLVAIKRILRQPGIDEMEWQDLTGRFRREGEAMAHLTRQYPKGFTTIFGSFEIEGDPCIVMKCEQ